MKAYVIQLSLVALVAGLVAGVVGAADLKPRRAANQAFMRNKLVYSQLILEGMALEKFDLISKNAIRLRDMTTSNHWFVMRQPDYVKHTTDYQKNIDQLYMAAVDKNLDAVTDGYLKVARSCVDCHRLVRLDQRRSSFDK